MLLYVSLKGCLSELCKLDSRPTNWGGKNWQFNSKKSYVGLSACTRFPSDEKITSHKRLYTARNIDRVNIILKWNARE